MQTTYNEKPAIAANGMPADSFSRNIETLVACSRQLEKVTIVTAANSEDYTVIINGTSYTITSDGTATKTEIRDALKVAIDAGSEPVSTEDSSTDALLIESTLYDTSFTISVTGDTPANISVAQLVAQEQALPFGVVAVYDERAAKETATGRVIGARLPRLATDISSRYIAGAVVRDETKEQSLVAPYGGYAGGEMLPVMKRGRIWMAVEDPASVVVGGLVYVRHVASSTEQLGAIRAADDGSDTDPLDASVALFTGQVSTSLGLAVVGWNLP
jgi:hypothetical protein